MKYRFAVMFNEMGESVEVEMKNMEGVSSIYIDDREKAKYCYKVFIADSKIRDEFIKRFNDRLIDLKSVSFSTFPRYVSQYEMEYLVSRVVENDLQQQLAAYPKSKMLVAEVLKHLDMKVPELAAMLDSRPQDVYNWLSMNAKPDRLKIVLLEYLLTCKDWSRDRFVCFLMSALESTIIKVSILNNKSKKPICEYNKTFIDVESAKAYALDIRKKFEGLDIKILVMDSNSENIKEYSTLKR